MQVTRLDTLDDARLDVFARLTDLQLRSRIEPEKGVFIAETVEVIGRVVRGGGVPIAMLSEEHHLHQIEGLLGELATASPTFELFVLPHEEVRRLTGFELNRGALCAFRRPSERSVADVCADASLVAVLEDIRNHTNVGAAFRSAAAMGVDAVLVTPACYDPLYRRALRVSMGTVFQVPWARIGDDPHDWSAVGVPQLRELGFTVAAMGLGDDSIPLDDPRLKACGRLALVFGTEGDGLADSTLSACDFQVRIPMSHGVDSLNVAASSAVAFWELRKR
ncbi:MAG: TrmH family RNA methyltransferase [Coriobacteriales bacterium]